MNVNSALSAIEELAASMITEERMKRVHLYGTLHALLQDLHDRAKLDGLSGYALEKPMAVKWSAQSIAGLDEGNGHPDSAPRMVTHCYRKSS